MWPGILHENKNKELDEKRKKRIKSEKELKEHFEGTLEDHVIQGLFYPSYFIQNGTDILTKKFGFCENCISYIGVSSNKRKLHNITVLNSYCKQLRRTVKPEQRCGWWNPNNFITQLIRNEVSKTKKSDPDYEEWVKPYIEEDY